MVESERKILYYKDYFIPFYLSEETGDKRKWIVSWEYLNFRNEYPIL